MGSQAIGYGEGLGFQQSLLGDRVERMNTNRHIIWGIGLSLLVHGLLLGFRWSPRGQHSVPALRTLPLEITLIGPKPRKDTPPEPKPTPQFRPKRVKRPITTQKKEVIRKREKPPAVVKSRPTPIMGKPRWWNR